MGIIVVVIVVIYLLVSKKKEAKIEEYNRQENIRREIEADIKLREEEKVRMMQDGKIQVFLYNLDRILSKYRLEDITNFQISREHLYVHINQSGVDPWDVNKNKSECLAYKDYNFTIEACYMTFYCILCDRYPNIRATCYWHEY